ncbi:hypothetical protein H6G36_02260 [Anabaena minutissima FACHB-250]|nr:hypothetical protein [Anabaena minutissima FACHB-250]
MKQEERQQIFLKVLQEASCPEALAEEAAIIATKYYPLGLAGATDQEISTFKQAQEYLRESDD